VEGWRGAPLDTDRGFGNRPLKHSGVVMRQGPTFQRLGPNAGGGAERGTGRCRFSDVVVVRLITGTALEVAGPWFGICGGS
jgi:hypothetical protein